MSTTTSGERFAQALAARRTPTPSSGCSHLLVSFRALTPGRAWESDDAAASSTTSSCGRWFAPDRVITQVLAIDCDQIGKTGAVEHVSYRLRATLPDGEFVIEQQAYLKSDGDRITWLHILCSGYVRAD